MKLSFASIILALIFFSCSKNTKNVAKLELNKVREAPIKDASPYLGEISNIKFESPGHFFTYDNLGNIKEFKDYKFAQVWGRTGKGVCEYTSITNFIPYQENLYIVDHSQGKYLVYDNPKAENCKEIFNNAVVRFASVLLFQNQPFFIRGYLVKTLDSDIPIIYKLNKKASDIVPANVTLQDLGIKLGGAPLQMGVPSARKNSNLIFYQPLTQKVFIYNTKSRKLKNFPANIYVAADKDIYDVKSLRKFMNLLNNKVEIVLNMFALKHGVALGYKKGVGKDQIWGLKVYTYDGEEIAEKKFTDQVVYMKNGTLMKLHLNADNKKNPYSLIVYRYSF